MSLFNLNEYEILTFFAVMIRYSVLFSILPIIGDKLVPVPVKILMALCVSVTLFPALVNSGYIHPGDAMHWGSTTAGIATVVALEVLVALILGFVAKMIFDAISFGGNLTGNFMGLAMATSYDPHQEAQTQLIAELQLAFATLIFLALDGHHLMLRAAMDSYRIAGIGSIQFSLGAKATDMLIALSGDVIRIGIEIAAPVAIALFAVNIAFAVLAKTMPQLNVLVLSLAASAFVGLLVMFLSVPEFQGAVAEVLGKVGVSMENMLAVMAGKRGA